MGFKDFVEPLRVYCGSCLSVQRVLSTLSSLNGPKSSLPQVDLDSLLNVLNANFRLVTQIKNATQKHGSLKAAFTGKGSIRVLSTPQNMPASRSGYCAVRALHVSVFPFYSYKMLSR